ncbi:hypothetical protein [Streptomyces sp. NPDC088789]|uniref:hypothetical protein n=1 Tax=Streptomyces sp. NPDC088789 TaxID=3365899 RepID=UPI003812D369
MAEGSVEGGRAVSGAGLRQAVTDFVYQLAEHVYRLAGCQESRDFPEGLPRYEVTEA